MKHPLLALLLCAPAAAQVPCANPDVIAAVVPPVASLGQAVEVTLTNNTNQTINLPSSCVYGAVYDDAACGGNIVSVSPCLLVLTPINPGQTKGQMWLQQNQQGSQVPAGEYSFDITYWDANFNLQGCCVSLLITPCTGPGSSYCSPTDNSTGGPGWLCADGTAVVANDDLILVAGGLPAGEFGYFLAGLTQGEFMPANSSGFLCLSGSIGRFNAPSQVYQGPTGMLDVDLTSIPVNPPTAVLPGDTWSFQGWYRDGGTNNFTNGLAVTFQ